MDKKLYRSRTDRKLFGVIGGLAKYLDFDARILRAIYLVISVFILILPVIVYLVAALIIPEAPENSEYQQVDYEPVDEN